MAQTRLGSGSSGPSLAGIINAAKLTNPAENAPSDLAGWNHETTEYGLTTRRPTKASTSHDENVSVGESDIRWVTGGDLQGYVTKYGDSARDIPQTYSDFDWDTYLGLTTALGGEDGFGIDVGTLQQALRVLSGGGRYSASRYTVIACGEMPWLFTGPEGTLLCNLDAVTVQDEKLTPHRVSIGTTEVNLLEEHPLMLAGLKQIINATDKHEIECYNGKERGTHTFGADAESLYSHPPDHGRETFARFLPDTLKEVGSLQSRDDVISQATALFDVSGEGLPDWEYKDETDSGIVLGHSLVEQSSANSPERFRGIKTVFLTGINTSTQSSCTVDRVTPLEAVTAPEYGSVIEQQKI